MTVKTHGSKRVMTFGEFIAGAYRAWGARRAKGIVWLAVNARLVDFQGPQRLVIPQEQHENLSFKTNAY
jgi:G3E family GTPase